MYNILRALLLGYFLQYSVLERKQYRRTVVETQCLLFSLKKKISYQENAITFQGHLQGDALWRPAHRYR